MTARWENDSFADSDRYYTDGVSLSITRGGASALDPWIDRLPWSDGHRTLGFEIAQTVFTPRIVRRRLFFPVTTIKIPHFGWEIQALPVAGLAVGNLLDEGYGGVVVRAGYRVPRDFGPTLLRGMGQLPPPAPERDGETGWGFAVHAGTQAHLVLRDMTLDGNSFRDGPRVDKNFFVPMGLLGMAVGNDRFQTCFSYVFCGQEFQGQDGVVEFGSVTLIWCF